MFKDFGFAGNGVQNSILSASYLSGVNTKKPYNVVFPAEFLQASPDSFGQGLEGSGAKMFSSVFDQQVILTADSLKNLPAVPTLHNNMPSSQKIGDYVRVVDYVYKGYPMKAYSQEDIKHQFLERTLSSNEPRTILVGTVDRQRLISNISWRCRQALIGNINVKNLNPQKNNPDDIKEVLNQVINTGDLKHAKELLGLPLIISNNENDPYT
jgi:hypothetical protein